MGLGVAFRAFFAALFNKDASSRIAAAMGGGATSAPTSDGGTTKTDPPKPKSDAIDPRAAWALLSGLQTEGRLIDFLREDLEGLDDADIGLAVREVHRGCREVVDKYFTLEPVRSEDEGDSVKVESGYDPSELRVIGTVGTPPFSGTLRHKGWRVTKTALPTLTGDDEAHKVLAPAELETD